MKKTLTLTLVALLAAAPAFAHGPKGGHDDGPRDHHEGPRGDHKGPRLDHFDTDGDGNITRAEYEAALATRFAEADTDGDGQLTAQELAAAKMRHHGERMIQRMDKDGNGTLSAEEMTPPRDIFADLDADGDGTITRAEAEAHKPPHRR